MFALWIGPWLVPTPGHPVARSAAAALPGKKPAFGWGEDGNPVETGNLVQALLTVPDNPIEDEPRIVTRTVSFAPAAR